MTGSRTIQLLAVGTALAFVASVAGVARAQVTYHSSRTIVDRCQSYYGPAVRGEYVERSYVAYRPAYAEREYTVRYEEDAVPAYDAPRRLVYDEPVSYEEPVVYSRPTYYRSTAYYGPSHATYTYPRRSYSVTYAQDRPVYVQRYVAPSHHRVYVRPSHRSVYVRPSHRSVYVRPSHRSVYVAPSHRYSTHSPRYHDGGRYYHRPRGWGVSVRTDDRGFSVHRSRGHSGASFYYRR
jgi:hypothetical protein